MTSFEKFIRSATWIMWLGRGVFFAVIIVLLLMRTVVTVIRIDGHSMDPTLRSGQWAMVDLISRRFQFQGWQYGDVVILRFPGDPLRSLYVKRVIGLPGDIISLENGRVMRNNVAVVESYVLDGQRTENGVVALPTIVPPKSYIVFGDNRQISNDSRFFGVVPEANLVGKVMFY